MKVRGQPSASVTFRISQGLLDRIDREVTEQRNQSSRTEFINDAVKFYLDYLENKRIEEWKILHESGTEDRSA